MTIQVNASRPAEAVSPAAGVSAARRSQRRASSSMWAIRITVIAVILSSWHVLTATKIVDPMFTGTPGGVWDSMKFILTDRREILTVDLPTTLREALSGFALASTLGITVALLLSEFQVVQRAVQPLVTAANAIPGMALAPLLILWFGLGTTSKVALIFSSLFFIVLINSVGAFVAVEQDRMLLARSLGISRRTRLWKFVVPGAVPVLASTLELALTFSFVGAIVGEMVGGIHGLGVQLQLSAASFRPNDYWAILLIVVLMTVGSVQILKAVQRRLLRWHEVESKAATE